MSDYTFDRVETIRRTASVAAAAVGAAVAVTLDGEGFYRLRTLRQWRSASGATPAGTQQPEVYEGTTTQDNSTKVYDGGAVGAGGLHLADPNRPFYTADGKVTWKPNPNLAGDDWQLVAYFERVRPA